MEREAKGCSIFSSFCLVGEKKSSVRRPRSEWFVGLFQGHQQHKTLISLVVYGWLDHEQHASKEFLQETGYNFHIKVGFDVALIATKSIIITDFFFTLKTSQM